jgi:hypothetical protein
MITLPIPKQAKQQEWNIILTIAKKNGFPLQIIHKLKNKIILKTQKIQTHTNIKKNKWGTFTYYSPLSHKVANLFNTINLKIAFWTNNIYTYNKLRGRMPLY